MYRGFAFTGDGGGFGGSYQGSAGQAAPGGGPYVFVNAEAEAVVGRFTVPPDDARKHAYDNFVGALKAAGLWTIAKLPLLYVAGPDEQSSLLNWTNATWNATKQSAPVFTADEGFTGNNSTDYIITGATPTLLGLGTVSDTVGFFTGTNSATAGLDCGNVASSGALGSVHAGSTPTVRVNAAASLAIAGGGSAPHHICGVRRDTSEHIGFRNGAQKTSFVTANSGTTSTGAIRFGLNNRPGFVVHPYGPALSDAEILALSNAITALWATVSAL
jgi:hypothetical protein